MMKDFEEQNFSVGRSYLSMGGGCGNYRQGSFRSAYGLVEVYQRVGDRPILSLRFLHNGRDHMRRWDASWGDKTIARLAREFAESVVAS